jgi:DNA-binding SARP family transcriptional activator
MTSLDSRRRRPRHACGRNVADTHDLSQSDCRWCTMRLRTFGGISIEGAAQALGGAAAQRRPLALLTVLAVAGERGMSREKVLGLLWPESDTDHARNALRQTLYALRRDLGAPELFLGVSDVRLNATTIASDLADFERALEAGELESAMSIYAGLFLDGFHVSDAPEFERWAERLGDRTTAARAYQLVIDAWWQGDPEAQSFVAEARRGLARVRPEVRRP